MPNFRVLSPERALEIIQAWINVSWPLPSNQAASIAADLGWTADDNNPGTYFSELSSTDEADCGFDSKANFVDWVDFPLSTVANGKEACFVEPIIADLVNQIEEVLIARYGQPERSEDSDGFKTDEWILGSGASFHIAYDELTVDVSVLSPEVTELMNDPAGDPNPDEEW